MKVEETKADNPMERAYNTFIESLFDLLENLESNSKKVNLNDEKLSKL
jgi:hypothetical protein